MHDLRVVCDPAVAIFTFDAKPSRCAAIPRFAMNSSIHMFDRSRAAAERAVELNGGGSLSH